MKIKKAIITGVTGQDGSYLVEFLLKRNYIVHGIKRKSSSFNTSRIDSIYNNKKFKKRFYLHYGDLTDTNSINSIIKKISPDEIYNFAAQSHVGISFEMPEYTTNVNALGTLRILDSIKFTSPQICFTKINSSLSRTNGKNKKESIIRFIFEISLFFEFLSQYSQLHDQSAQQIQLQKTIQALPQLNQYIYSIDLQKI